jgi:hypothetical protein
MSFYFFFFFFFLFLFFLSPSLFSRLFSSLFSLSSPLFQFQKRPRISIVSMLVSTASFAPIAATLSNKHNNLPKCFDPNSNIFANDSIDDIDFKKSSLASPLLTHQILQVKGVSLHNHQILIWVLYDLVGFEWDLIWVLCDDG